MIPQESVRRPKPPPFDLVKNNRGKEPPPEIVRRVLRTLGNRPTSSSSTDADDVRAAQAALAEDPHRDPMGRRPQ